jgi:hypothetical protein
MNTLKYTGGRVPVLKGKNVLPPTKPVKVTVVVKKPTKLEQYHSSRGIKKIVK